MLCSASQAMKIHFCGYRLTLQANRRYCAKTLMRLRRALFPPVFLRRNWDQG